MLSETTYLSYFPFSEKVASHISHLKGLIPWWTYLVCLFKLFLDEKDFRQIGHCTRGPLTWLCIPSIWFFKLRLSANVLLHSVQATLHVLLFLGLFTFSWISRIWFFKLSLSPNFSLHNVHLNRFPWWYLSVWRFTLTELENIFLQVPHFNSWSSERKVITNRGNWL